MVYHILSGCDIYYGLCLIDELLDQVLMLLGTITHREASLHGVEFVPGLDLCRGQRHRRAMTDAMECDLLNVGQNVVEASVDEGAPSIDGVRGHIRRQLEGLQLHR